MSFTSLTLDELRRHPLPPVAGGDKHDHGRLLLVAGSRDLGGAPLLTGLAAMRVGVGNLKIATVESAAAHLAVAMPEAMVRGMPEANDGGLAAAAIEEIANLASDVDAVAGGPGMIVSDTSDDLAERLCRCGTPLVLDAALLRVLPQRKQAAKGSNSCLILLPHSGELAALLQCDREEVEADPVDAGKSCASRYDAIVLVKGAVSHVVTPEGAIWQFEGGGPGLGVSGSGDVLAGIVGGLLARGAEPLAALLWAVWLHGEAGRALGAKVAPVGFLAREIPGELPALMAQASLE